MRKVHSTLRNMRGERVYPQQLAVGEQHYMTPCSDGRLIVGRITKRVKTVEWKEEYQTTWTTTEATIRYDDVIVPDANLKRQFAEADRKQGW